MAAASNGRHDINKNVKLREIYARSPSFASSSSDEEDALPPRMDVATQTMELIAPPPNARRKSSGDIESKRRPSFQTDDAASPTSAPEKRGKTALAKVAQELMKQKDDRLASVLLREEVGLSKVRQKMALLQKALADSEDERHKLLHQLDEKCRELDELSTLTRIAQAHVDAWCKGGDSKNTEELKAMQMYYKKKVATLTNNLKKQGEQHRAHLRPVVAAFRQLAVDNQELAHTTKAAMEWTIDHLKTDVQTFASDLEGVLEKMQPAAAPQASEHVLQSLENNLQSLVTTTNDFTEALGNPNATIFAVSNSFPGDDPNVRIQGFFPLLTEIRTTLQAMNHQVQAKFKEITRQAMEGASTAQEKMENKYREQIAQLTKQVEQSKAEAEAANEAVRVAQGAAKEAEEAARSAQQDAREARQRGPRVVEKERLVEKPKPPTRSVGLMAVQTVQDQGCSPDPEMAKNWAYCYACTPGSFPKECRDCGSTLTYGPHATPALPVEGASPQSLVAHIAEMQQDMKAETEEMHKLVAVVQEHLEERKVKPKRIGVSEQAAIDALMQWKRKRQAMLERRQRILAECFRIVKACNWPVNLPPSSSPPSSPESPSQHYAANQSAARHNLNDSQSPVGFGGTFDSSLLHVTPPRHHLKMGKDMRYNVPRLDPMGLVDGESLMTIGALHRGHGPATDGMPRIGNSRTPVRPSGVNPGTTSPKPSFRSIRPTLGTLSHGINAVSMQDQLITSGAGLDKGDVDRAASGVRGSTPKPYAVAQGTTCSDMQ